MTRDRPAAYHMYLRLTGVHAWRVADCVEGVSDSQCRMSLALSDLLPCIYYEWCVMKCNRGSVGQWSTCFEVMELIGLSQATQHVLNDLLIEIYSRYLAIRRNMHIFSDVWVKLCISRTAVVSFKSQLNSPSWFTIHFRLKIMVPLVFYYHSY